MLDLFIYERGKLRFNRAEVLIIPEFSDLINRHITSPNDSANEAAAKKKLIEERYFKYVYFMAHWRSPYITLNEKRRSEAAKKDAGFLKDWKPDGKVKAAIKKFEEIQMASSPEIRVLNNLKRGLEVSNDMIEVQINRLYALLEQLSLIDLTKIDIKSEDFILHDTYLKSIKSEIKELLPMGTKIKDNLDTINNIEKAIKVAQENEKFSKGGRPIGNRAD